jgi:eukaryotic-like serine/threonine-protein kinase
MKAGLPVGADAVPLVHFGRYRTIEVLGTGAMGIVFRAHDPGIDRDVALKVLRREMLVGSQGAEMQARFRNEAVTAGRLAHPGITAIYELGEDHQTAFIAMELAPGVNLTEYVAEHELLSLRDIQGLMKQLLAALDYAHAKGVVHRDIKPANLLISKEGQLKITDFGIARLRESKLTQVGSMMGTPCYMAPEQYLGEAADQRADLFAAGVVLYELLVGKLPFMADSVEAVGFQVCHVDPELPSVGNPYMPVELDAVIARALAKQRKDRFGTALEFAAALESAMTSNGRAGPARLAAARGGPGVPSTPPAVAPTLLHSPGGPRLQGQEVTSTWPPETLRMLESSLAGWIGPIAKVLVKRAASETRNFDELCSRLRGYLATELEQTMFLAKVAELRRAS